MNHLLKATIQSEFLYIFANLIYSPGFGLKALKTLGYAICHKSLGRETPGALKV